MRILVAHEDARTRGRIEREGRRFHATDIALASSPEDARRLLRSWQPDVVLMSAPMAAHWTAERIRPPRRSTSSARMPGRGPVGAGQQADPAGRGRSARELATVIGLLRSDGGGGIRRAGDHRSRERSDASTDLAPVELEVMTELAHGLTTSQIAAAQGVPEDVIDGHIAGVLAKLQRRDRGT